MSSLVRAVSPRDRTAAARTILLVAVVGLLANVTWEGYAMVAGVPTSTVTSAAGTITACVLLVAVAVACHRSPERVPPAVYPLLPPVAVALQVGICLANRDATAAGQIGFIYPVVYAAAHFRPPFAWCTAVTALAGDAVVALRLLPPRQALSDLIVMAAAVGMLTIVLVTTASYQAHLVTRLNALATADPLTGLLTRRELERAVDRLLAGRPASGPRRPERRSGDVPTTAALVLVDVDRFKDLNDTHGHPVGDAALVHLAGLVRSVVRPSDTVARLGGDELALLLPGSLDEVLARAHAVRDAVRRSPLRVADGEVAITVSVGVTHARAGSVTFAELYAAADAALYRAKLAGRDAVVASRV